MIISRVSLLNKKLTFIPFFFTFANALLGALAVLKAIDEQFVFAVYCILLAAFMDGLDGRLARLLNSSSGLGAELDSLCDAISFCFSPVILLYSWEVSDYGAIGPIVLGVYLCAGLFRLARFNTFHQESTSFFGLPTPVAAFFVLSFILHRDWFERNSYNFIFNRFSFCAIIIFVAFLMVSNIPFPSFKFDGSKSKWLFLFSTIFAGFCFVKHYPIFFLMPLIYIFIGIARQSYARAMPK